MSDEQDKQDIRNCVDKWLLASKAGDLDQLLPMLAEDVVFLLPGREPMRGREGFAAASRSMAGKMMIDGRPEIREITISGNYAYTWNYLTISITPMVDGKPAGAAMKREGNILSVFRREADGRWVLWRDANMLQ